MLFVRAAAVSVLAMLAVLQTSGEASADHRLRMKVLWPRVYAPRLSGYLYNDEFDDEDEGFYDPEDEEEYIPRRRRHGRDIVLDWDEEDLEPVYEPRRKVVKAKPKPKSATAKKVVKKPAQATVAVVKPKVKPMAKPEVKTALISSAQAATPPASKTLTSPVIAKAPVSTAIKAEPPLASAAVKPVVPQTVAPKAVPTKTQVASAAPTAGTIGCSKGAEIVSGYGFTSVKPKVCTGATYSFDAARATNAYRIKVAATTGEITDVQKLR